MAFVFIVFSSHLIGVFLLFVPHDTDFGCKEDNRKKTTPEILKTSDSF